MKVTVRPMIVREFHQRTLNGRCRKYIYYVVRAYNPMTGAQRHVRRFKSMQEARTWINKVLWEMTTPEYHEKTRHVNMPPEP